MRHSVGGAWLFTISITLMMFIIAYVSITIDYSNAYQLKNDIILIIEQYNGLNGTSANKIIGRMNTRKYASDFECSKDYDTSTYYHGTHDGNPSPKYVALIRDNSGYKFVTVDAYKGAKQFGYVCIYKYIATKEDALADKSGKLAVMDKAFYAVTTSFGFNFPIIGEIFDYRVTGETGVINYPNDSFAFGS